MAGLETVVVDGLGRNEMIGVARLSVHQIDPERSASAALEGALQRYNRDLKEESDPV